MLRKRRRGAKTGRMLAKQAKASVAKALKAQKLLKMDLEKVQKDVKSMMTHVHNTPPPPPYTSCP
jgi:hypothetical protein